MNLEKQKNGTSLKNVILVLTYYYLNEQEAHHRLEQ